MPLGFLRQMGAWGKAWGCSEGSGRVFHCFRAVVGVSEGARAGDTGVVNKSVDDDVAV